MLRGRGGKKVQVRTAASKSAGDRRNTTDRRESGKSSATGKGRKSREKGKTDRRSDSKKPATRAPKKSRSKSGKGKKK